jgi:hypothetical protein
MSKEQAVNSVNYMLSTLNKKGIKEYAAWFLYYHSMEYTMINLLTEDQIRHCYIVIKDIATKREHRKK